MGELNKAGWSYRELRHAGFKGIKSVRELKQESPYLTVIKLKEMGYTAQEMYRVGLRGFLSKITTFGKDILGAHFDATDKEISRWFTDKEILGAHFDVKDMKAAGFKPRDMRHGAYVVKRSKSSGWLYKHPVAAYTACELKGVFRNADIKKAGYSAKGMAACFSPAALVEMGWKLEELRSELNWTLEDFLKARVSAGDLKQLGYTAKELADAPALNIKHYVGNPVKCDGNPANVKTANDFLACEMGDIMWFSAKDLYHVGFSATEIAQTGRYTPEQVANQNLDDWLHPREIRAAYPHFTAIELLENISFWSSSELRMAGFSKEESAAALKEVNARYAAKKAREAAAKKEVSTSSSSSE